MSTFVINNQDGHYLNKQKEWCDGRDNRILYRAKHKDEAINIVFELSSKDIWLRANAIECELDASNNPSITTLSDTPVPPQPSEIAAQKKSAAEAAAHMDEKNQENMTLEAESTPD